MQRGRAKKLKYAIAAVATAAVLAITPFTSKKCMKEDIQKRMEPEGPKRGMVTENKRYDNKKMTKELSKLITSVTEIEENIDGPEHMNEDVKKIIDEFPYEKLNCKKIPAEKFEEYEAMAKEEMDALPSKTKSDSVRKSIEKLGEEGKVDELMAVLDYYASLGSHYNTQLSPGLEVTFSEYQDYLRSNDKAAEDGEDIYDPVCVIRHLHLSFRIDQVLGTLSNIWIKNEDDIKGLREIVPETYKPELGGPLIYRLFSPDVSQEYFNDSMHFLVETYGTKRLGIWIRTALIAGKKDATILVNLVEQTENEELEKELDKILKGWDRQKKTSEDVPTIITRMR
jgi:hypothetical protein